MESGKRISYDGSHISLWVLDSTVWHLSQPLLNVYVRHLYWDPAERSKLARSTAGGQLPER